MNINSASNKQIEGVVVVLIFLVLWGYLGWRAFSHPPLVVSSSVQKAPVEALESATLTKVAKIAADESKRFGVPVAKPGADQLGKPQLFN